jgi:cobalamin biosynthetic protein CobC
MHETSQGQTRVLAAGSHGGNLAEARRLFPQAPEPWLDLSAAASPHAYPSTDLQPDIFARLPEEEDLRRLEAAAANFYGVADASRFVAAPGTQTLIQWLPQLIAARRVGILGFTYSEHARSWRMVGADVRTCESLDELADMDVAVVVNPNNPDGRLVPAADLRDVAARVARRGGFLVVDEAFIDFLPRDASLVSEMPAPGAIVLRSFGKTFGLPGLRLGFAVAPPDFCARLRAALGPWPVSSAAIAIGCKALADHAWLAATRARLAADAGKLDACLAAASFTPVGATPLFRLVHHPDAAAIFDRLGRTGIWVRRFAERPGWLRFSIPREADLSRLGAALKR